jgi:hypothetical protein
MVKWRLVAHVVVLILTKRCCRMPLIDDQDAVEEFATDRTDEAFGDRIGARCLHGRPDDADADRGEYGVERGGGLGVAVPDQEPVPAPGVVEIHAEVSCLLGQPGSGGVGSDPEDVHAACGVLDDEEDVEPAQGDGVEVEQVAGENRMGLGPQELGP